MSLSTYSYREQGYPWSLVGLRPAMIATLRFAVLGQLDLWFGAAAWRAGQRRPGRSGVYENEVGSMAKGLNRRNREVRKPKAEKPKVAAGVPNNSMAALLAAASDPKKKK